MLLKPVVVSNARLMFAFNMPFNGTLFCGKRSNASFRCAGGAKKFKEFALF